MGPKKQVGLNSEASPKRAKTETPVTGMETEQTEDEEKTSQLTTDYTDDGTPALTTDGETTLDSDLSNDISNINDHILPAPETSCSPEEFYLFGLRCLPGGDLYPTTLAAKHTMVKCLIFAADGSDYITITTPREEAEKLPGLMEDLWRLARGEEEGRFERCVQEMVETGKNWLLVMGGEVDGVSLTCFS